MKRLKTRIIIETLGLAGILSFFFLFLHKSFVALGILIGAFTGIGSFYLLARYILASTSIGLGKIKPYFFLKYLMRYAIMGVVLFFCAKIGLNFFFGAALGLSLIYLPIFKECKTQLK